MNERTKARVLRLLEEADSRADSVTYEDLPKRFLRRAETIWRKLVDLREDILAEPIETRPGALAE